MRIMKTGRSIIAYMAALFMGVCGCVVYGAD